MRIPKYRKHSSGVSYNNGSVEPPSNAAQKQVQVVQEVVLPILSYLDIKYVKTKRILQQNIFKFSAQDLTAP